MPNSVVNACTVKLAFNDADTNTDILADIARVGRKDVGVSDESESVSASWNTSFNACI